MSKRVNYRRLYDRLAPFYAPAMFVLPFWRRYTEVVLPHLPPGGAVLEIGPGPGVLLGQLAVGRSLAVGFDLSPGMLRQAHRRLHRAGLPSRLVQGNAVALPFAAASFDGVALTFVFSAIPDGGAAMQQIARVLRPGGIVALVDACEPDDGSRVARWLARQWERFGDSMRDEAALMRQAGLEVRTRREFGAFRSIRLTVGQKNS